MKKEQILVCYDYDHDNYYSINKKDETLDNDVLFTIEAIDDTELFNLIYELNILKQSQTKIARQFQEKLTRVSKFIDNQLQPE